MSENQVPIQNAFQLVGTHASDLRFTLKGTLIPNLNFDFKLDDQIVKIIADGQDENKLFQVSFHIRINTTPDVFSLSTLFNVVFKCEKEITAEFMGSPMIQINAKAIAFPFVRSYISTITVNSGIPPIILPALNFAKRVHADT